MSGPTPEERERMEALGMTSKTGRKVNMHEPMLALLRRALPILRTDSVTGQPMPGGAAQSTTAHALIDDIEALLKEEK